MYMIREATILQTCPDQVVPILWKSKKCQSVQLIKLEAQRLQDIYCNEYLALVGIIISWKYELIWLYQLLLS